MTFFPTAITRSKVISIPLDLNISVIVDQTDSFRIVSRSSCLILSEELHG